MLEEEKKHCLKHALCTFLAALLGGFLAFYVVMDITLSRMLDPIKGMKQAEKMMRHQAKEMRRFENDILLPAPMGLNHALHDSIVTMQHEDDIYRFTVDLKQLNDNEKNVNVTVNSDTVNIKGVVDKSKRNRNSIIEFSQTFALGSKILQDKVTKTRQGDKYIITVPVEY